MRRLSTFLALWVATAGVALGGWPNSGRIYPISAAPAGLLFDSMSPTIIFSPRKLRTLYAGSAYRVRRDGVSAGESDIGFSGNNEDLTGLLTYCASVNCWLVTYYDQSGNAYDMTQGNTARQPQIVSSGSLLNPINSHPALTFTSANFTNLQNSSVALSQVVGASAFTIMSSSRITAGVAGLPENAGAILTDVFGGYLQHAAAQSTAYLFNAYDSADRTVSISATYPTTHVAYHDLSGGTESAALDGGPLATTAMGSLGATTFKIGMGLNYNASVYLDAIVQEFVAFGASQTKANANAIGSSFGTYAGQTWTAIP